MCQENPSWRSNFAKNFQKMIDSDIKSIIASVTGGNSLNQGYLTFFQGFQTSVNIIKKNKKSKKFKKYIKTLNTFRDAYSKAYLSKKLDSEYCDCLTFLNSPVQDEKYKALLTQRMATLKLFCKDTCNMKQIDMTKAGKKAHGNKKKKAHGHKKKKVQHKKVKKSKSSTKKHHKKHVAKKHLKKKHYIKVKLSDYPKKHHKKHSKKHYKKKHTKKHTKHSKKHKKHAKTVSSSSTSKSSSTTTTTKTTNTSTPTKTVLPCCPSEFACPDKVIIKIKENVKVMTTHIPYPVFKEHNDKYFKCPPEFKQINDKTCVHKIPKESGSCPPRYIRISDGECIRIIVIPPKHPNFLVECPEGYTKYGELGCRIGGEHSKKFPLLPKIVEPKHKNPYVEIPEPFEHITCPLGYRRVGDFQCKKILHCPKGYILEEGKCKYIRVTCPAGTKKVGNRCITPKGEDCTDDDDNELRE